MPFYLLSTIKVKLVVEKMQNAEFMCHFTRQAQQKKNHLSRLHRAPCSNITENSGKHFILQGRRVKETNKINP